LDKRKYGIPKNRQVRRIGGEVEQGTKRQGVSVGVILYFGKKKKQLGKGERYEQPGKKSPLKGLDEERARTKIISRRDREREFGGYKSKSGRGSARANGVTNNTKETHSTKADRRAGAQRIEATQMRTCL